MKCNKCGSTNIKTRKNYPYGKRGRAVQSRMCIQCGSVDIEVVDPNRRRRRR